VGVVREVRQLCSKRTRFVVDDAGAATPIVVEAVERLGGTVASAREDRPSFDEVFARLVERQQASGERTDAESRAAEAAA
jgi:hypothetical protein